MKKMTKEMARNTIGGKTYTCPGCGKKYSGGFIAWFFRGMCSCGHLITGNF